LTQEEVIKITEETLKRAGITPEQFEEAIPIAKELVNLEKITKICPYCFRKISILHSSCPYCNGPQQNLEVEVEDPNDYPNNIFS
jgi:hypothetical protein